MKKILALFAALFVGSSLVASELGKLPEEWGKAPNWLLPWTDGQRVVIRDFKGNDLIELVKTCVAYPCRDASKDRYDEYHAKIKSAIQLDPQIVRVEYVIRNKDIKEHYALIVSEGGPRMRIENRIVFKDGSTRFGTVSPGAVCRNKLTLVPVKGSSYGESFSRGGVWRKPEQGESYEASGATFVPCTVPSGELYLWYDSIGSFRKGPNPEPCLRYQSSDVTEALRDAQITAEKARGAIMPATGEHFEKENGTQEKVAESETPNTAFIGEHAYSNVINLYLFPWENSAFVAAAMQTGAALAATITTGKDFNIFNSAKETAGFSVAMMNPRNAPTEVACRVIARNYDGKEDVNESFSVKLKPYEITSRHFKLPKRTRDYWFVNAEFDDKKTNSFVRADIACLEPYKYKSLDTSIIGIAANFEIPSAAACDKLLTRMGARWIRSSGMGETEKYAKKNRRGILSFHLDRNATNEEQRLAFAKEKLQDAVARDCPIVEIGNELNFGAKGDEIRKRCASYSEWLKAFYDARAALKLEKKVKISTFGFAGCVDGGAFYKAMDKVGCWDYCDVLSLHPGRLNQTPDNPGPDWQWNYRAQIQSTKGFIRQLREQKGKALDLILTEVYARTPPNKNDSDSTRSAVENVILSCALAKVEGATALNWYQMHDSVHTAIGSINEHNTEYHYGLLRRDGTVKPSLLAFCTISEALDGAEFVREVGYEDSRKAWFFNTPRGEMAIIYDRKDGYYPYDGMFTGRPFVGHLEPWLDHWKSHTEYRFAAPKGGVTVRDAIGRTRKIKAGSDGFVTLKLSGAPLIVYGLGAPAPAEKLRTPLDLGLVTAEGGTVEEINLFHDMGGNFVFDNKLDSGFAEYTYFPLPEDVRPGRAATDEMKSLYGRGVRRIVVPILVKAQGENWNVKQEDAKQQGQAWATRLTPYAAARKTDSAATPEIWVLPQGNIWAAMYNGVRDLADGVAFMWDSFPWSRPAKQLWEVKANAKNFNLPFMVLNFGPATQAKGLMDSQFFGALLMLNLQPNCRAIALTNLRDTASGIEALGDAGLAATICEKVARYSKFSGLFDVNGDAKSRLKAASYLHELTRNCSAPEYSVSRKGLRTVRFWNGKVPCAVVWQGNRAALTGGRIDDLTGTPEATESEVEARVASKNKLKVFDIYGASMNVPVANGKATLKIGEEPIVLCGVDTLVEKAK